MFDWNKAVDKRFGSKKEKDHSLESLLESAFSQVKKQLLFEKRYLLSENQVIKYSAIPEISVSELGWTSIETRDTGEVVSSEQRQQLEQYLRNITGNTFQEKIKSLSDFFSMSPEAAEDSPLMKSDTNSSKIQKVISYLVFYKTLTTIVTNFNAASAGFTFEAFLAVLLGGRQVPANTGTIADFYDSEGTPLSLKLYAESSVEVGGSFRDLMGDLINPKSGVRMNDAGLPFVRYLVCAKSLQGRGLEAQGTISIYQFDFDLDNVFDSLVRASDHNKKLIQIPMELISNPDADLSKVISEARASAEDKKSAITRLDQAWITSMNGALESADDKVKELIDSQEGVENFLNVVKTSLLSKDAYGKKTLSYKAAVKNLDPSIVDFLNSTYQEAMEESKTASGFASTARSLQFYNQASPELKKKILQSCYGYVNTEQFGMRFSGVKTLVGSDEPNVGRIVIGRKNIEETLNKCIAMLNTSIFDIFENLKELTSSINGYVASGLSEREKAELAQESAKNIDKKTEEIKSQTT
jgi:hypothetical protein